MTTVQTTTPTSEREPTLDQADTINELALQYDAIGCAWEPDSDHVLVVACFDVTNGPVQIDRFRLLGGGLPLNIPPDHPAWQVEINYPEEA
jgi:hypothetical protein